MSIRPVDMQLMVQNTTNIPKGAMEKVEHNSALAQHLSNDFNKKVNKVVDQKIDTTKNEHDVNNRYKQDKKNKKRRRKKEKEKQEEERTIHLDLSV